MSFLKENRYKIIILTVFSLSMAVLLRIYSGLNLWMKALSENQGIKELIKIIVGSWQLYVFFIIVLSISCVLVFLEKVRAFVYRYRFAIAGVIFILCVIFEISGSSMGQWCNDFGAVDNDIIAGISRPIRTDEYCVTAPFLISKAMNKSNDLFEYFNNYTNGCEVDMFMGIRQPINHILTVFRPFLTGFLFLSPEKGMAFWWCGKLLVLFLATFEMGMLITDKNKVLSFTMTMLITFASVIQWWFSTSVAEIIIYTEVAMLLFNRYLTEPMLWKRMFLLLAIIYQAGCFILLLYPAWQVPFVYIILILTVWIIIKNLKHVSLRWFDYTAITLSVVGLVAILIFIFSKSADTVKLISGSVYPGERFETGGGNFKFMFTYPLDMWFNVTNFRFGYNECESATFFSFFPFSIIIPVIAMLRNKKRDILSIILIAVNAFFFIWIVFGFPEKIAKITFMSNSQSIRTMLAFGFVNIMLIIRGAAILRKPFKTTVALLVSSVVSAIVIAIAAIAVKDMEWGPEYKLVLFAGSYVILFFMVLLLFNITKKKYSFLAVLLITVISTVYGIMINPIRKGLDSVYNIELFKEINNVKAGNEAAVWAIECSQMNGYQYANAGLICGVKTVNSTSVYPNLELWGTFDTVGNNEDVYNRYTHTGICIKESGESEFELVEIDSFKLTTTFDELHRAGVTYVTAFTNLSKCAESAACKVTRVNDSDTIYIYMLE